MSKLIETEQDVRDVIDTLFDAISWDDNKLIRATSILLDITLHNNIIVTNKLTGTLVLSNRRIPGPDIDIQHFAIRYDGDGAGWIAERKGETE